MFQKLKECKTLKEIFTLLGTSPFEKAAFLLVFAWCLLPFYSAIEHFYWGLVGVNSLQKNYAIMEGYKLAVQLVGSLSLYLALFFVLGRISVYGKTIFQKLKKEPWHLFLLLMLIWSVIAALLSDDRTTSVQGSIYRFDGLKTYFYYAGTYICAFLLIKEKNRKIILNVFAFVANLVALILILQEQGIEIITRGFMDERASVFFHYNHAGYYLNMSIVCLIGLYLHEERRVLRILFAGSMVLQMCALLLNNTTGGYVGTCCAMCMGLVFYFRKNKKLSFKMAVPVVILFLISVASYAGMLPNSSGEDMKANMENILHDAQQIAQKTEDDVKVETDWDAEENLIDIGNGRTRLWTAGLKMIPERPIFGYGPEQINQRIAKEKAMWVDRVANEYLQYAIFIGIPGLIFYLSALIVLFIHQWRKMNNLSKNTLIAAGCVIAYLISAFFGNTMFYTTPYFFMFLGLAAARTENEISEK